MSNKNLSPLEKIQQAKSRLIVQQAFFASLLCNTDLIETQQIPTMATDGDRIFYNSNFVGTMTVPETQFVLCHEIMHIVLDHCARLSGRNMKKWNYATDYVINQMLVDEGPRVGTMPACGLLDRDIYAKGGGMPDKIYGLLPDEDENGGGGDQGGKGFDQLQEAPGGEAEKIEREMRVKVRISQAAQAAKMQGQLSANMARIVGNIVNPKVDWRTVLRRFVASKAKIEYSFARPKRRTIDDDILLPSLTGEALGKLVIAVDCSGSIGGKELDEFAAEIRAIHGDCRPEKVHVVYFDHGICHTDAFGPDDTITVTPHGGGGTAFSPIFKHIDKEDIDPVATIVLTDLCCNDFGDPPPYPVLWVTTMKGNAPWGEIVEM